MPDHIDTHWGLYLIADPGGTTSAEHVSEVVTESVRGGATVIQVRDKTASDAVFAEQALRIRGAVSRTVAEPGPHTPFRVPVFVNDRFRVALRHGFHLHIGRDDIDYLEARRRMPGELMIGVSVDEPDYLTDLLTACTDQGVRLPDVIGIGPVWSNKSRRRQVPPLGTKGVDEIARLALKAGVTSVAVGGISVDNVQELGVTAVDGICVSSALMTSSAPRDTARQLLTRFRPSAIHSELTN
ncbi:thiamine phosphate synthase [Corynebacterium sp. CCM 9204]